MKHCGYKIIYIVRIVKSIDTFLPRGITVEKVTIATSHQQLKALHTQFKTSMA
jgi:hypothetical protein